MKTLEVRSPFGTPVYHAQTVTSTMDVSRKLACEGAAHGTVIMADFQEAGRGRGLKRTWEMESGVNLPFTVLLCYPCAEKIPQALTLRSGLAVSLAIEETTLALKNKVKIKWPNDIMINNKKTCGIICEADVAGFAGVCNVFVGIGINVMQKEFPPHLQSKATSIFLETGEIKDRFYLLENILERLYYELEHANDDWKDRIEQRLYKKNEEVSFIEGGADSKNEIKGRLTGINENGELLIAPEGEQEPKNFITGELRIY